MVLSDRITGAAFALTGAAIALYARGLPLPAGAASPRLFPTIVGVLMVLTGALIVLRDLRGGAGNRAGAADSAAQMAGQGAGTVSGRPSGAQRAEAPEDLPAAADDPPSHLWMRDPRKLAMVLGVPVLIVAYGLLAPVLGALLMSMLVITIYALLWSERPLPAILTGVIVGFVVVAFFAWGMNVQLPRGVLGLAL